jgi:Ca2+/Na+ antiporter
VGSLAYAALVLILRVTGKRTLSKMNAFDLVVTVALGSTLATVLLSRDVALAEGVTALLLLCLLQYAVTFLSVRSSAFQDFVKARPTLIFHRGRYLEDAMRKERVTREEDSRRAPLAGSHRRGIGRCGGAGDRRFADRDGIGGEGLPAAGPCRRLDGGAAMKPRARSATKQKAERC